MNLVEMTSWLGTATPAYINTDTVNRLTTDGAFGVNGVWERDEAVRNFYGTISPATPPPPGLVFLVDEGGNDQLFQTENVVALVAADRFGVPLTKVVPVAGAPFVVQGELATIVSDFEAAAVGGGSNAVVGDYDQVPVLISGNLVLISANLETRFYFTEADMDRGYTRVEFTIVVAGAGPGPWSGRIIYALPPGTTLADPGILRSIQYSDAYQAPTSDPMPIDWQVTDGAVFSVAPPIGSFNINGVTAIGGSGSIRVGIQHTYYGAT